MRRPWNCSPVVVLVAFSLLIASCGGAAPTQPPPTIVTSQPTAAPQPQPTPTPQPTAVVTPRAAATGQLRVALAVMEFDLWTVKLFARKWLDPIYDSIVGATADGQLDQSGLATEWQSSPDFKTWTLKLRKGVSFHNGDQVTSSDVKGTVEFHTSGPGKGFSPRLTANLLGIDTPDDLTAVIRLKDNDFLFPEQWASPHSMAMIEYLFPMRHLNSVGPETFSKKAAVGSGPYKVKDVNVGTSISYEAVDNHWYYGRPRYKMLEFLHIPEENTRTALLRTERAELIESSRALGGDLGKSGFNVFVKKGAGVGNIFIHQQHTPYPGGNPLANVKVREALSISIDRQTIVDAFLKGLATPSMDYPVLSWDIAYQKLPVPPFNPDRARQLLREAGYPAAFPLDVVIYPFTGVPEGPEIMEAVTAWWGGIGVKVNRVPIDYVAFQKQWFAQSLERPSVSGVIYLANGRINISRTAFANKEAVHRTTEDPKMDELSKQWQGAANEEEYVRIGRLAQRYMAEQWFVIPLFEAGDTYVASKNIAGNWDLGKFPYSMRIKSLAAGK